MEKKKFVAVESGRITFLEDGKFKSVGRVTYGIDDKGRNKVIINIDNRTYSAFLRKVLTKEQKEKVEAYTTQLINRG